MRKIGDYPEISRAHMALAKKYSSTRLIGPPMCDELVSLVEHMFSEEEAEVAKHLKPWRPMTAKKLAAATGLPLREVEAMLDVLAHEKHVLFSFGRADKERYCVLPIIPGTFENVLIRRSADSVTPWHVRFAELHEELFSTGFTVEYLHKPVDSVRYLPVGEAVEAQPMAFPSDRLELILDRYEHFAVGVCQCRLSKQLVGEGCGRSLEVCTAMGTWAPEMVRRGQMKQASREDVLEIKRGAEKEGLVSWMMNEESGKFTNSSCSCCGCCCGALRSISEFNTPGFIAPPHFMPGIDHQACNSCVKCVKVCPMGALHMLEEGETKRLLHKPERCIGCGLCVVACSEEALTLKEVEGYKEPPSGWPAYLAKYARNHLVNSWKVWSTRRHSH
jgi:electron transport complex protein RnfB